MEKRNEPQFRIPPPPIRAALVLVPPAAPIVARGDIGEWAKRGAYQHRHGLLGPDRAL